MYLALIFLKKRKRSSIIAMLGIAFSFTALIIGLGISNGLSQNTVSNILSISPHIKSQNRFGPIVNYDYEISKILKINNVLSAYPKIDGKGIIKVRKSGHKVTEGILLEGYIENDLSSIKLDEKLIKGELDISNNGILIGEELANFLGVDIGDKVKVTSQENIEEHFVVKAIYSTGFYSYDSNFGIISFDRAQKLFKLDGATEIDIKLKDIYDAEKTLLEVENETLLISTSWLYMNKQLLKGIRLERRVILFLLSILLVITSFIVSALTSVIVAERRRDIAILRVIGFSRFKIASSFLLVSLTISILGILFGALLSYFLYYLLTQFSFDFINDIYYIPEKIPFIISIYEILLVSLLGEAIVILSSIFPVLKTFSIDPVEVLKYE